jgi:excisionase family DNA binding protein
MSDNADCDNYLGSRLWTVREVSEFLGVHEKTVYEWAARKELPCFHIGKLLRFSPTELARWVSARKEE